ncbi:unnamed protein product [Leptosia nina]|uniref:Uncharacterized protein n=1 Tax=Leptosia nina TaxID=320188 RepID=A0AAV1JZI6_9NEOP
MEEQSKEEELLQLRLELLKLQQKVSSLEGHIPNEDPLGSKTNGGTSSPARAAQESESDLSKLASAIMAAIQPAEMMCQHNLDLPRFNGSHSEWLAFQSAYRQTARHLSDVENMARLRRCLVGKAKEAVRSLLIYHTNPEEIMKLLESRFGRPDAIAITELESLRNLPKPGNTPRDLCMFTSRFCNIVCSLEALEKIYYLYNPEITRSTVEKLSTTLQHRFFAYAAQQPKQEADLLKLKRFLCTEADNCAPFARPESNFESKKPQVKLQRIYVTKDLKVRNNCVICDKNGHTVIKCLVFNEWPVDKRWAKAKEKCLCFRCLKPRSTHHTCPTIQCGVDECQRSHHALLHVISENNDMTSIETVVATSRKLNYDLNEKAQDLLEQHTHQEVDGIFETTKQNHSNASPPETCNIAHKSMQAVGIQLDRNSQLETRYEQEIKTDTYTNKNIVDQVQLEKDVTTDNVNHVAFVEEATPVKVCTGRSDTSSGYKGVAVNYDLVEHPNLPLVIPHTSSTIFKQDSLDSNTDMQESFKKMKMIDKDRNMVWNRAKGKETINKIVKKKQRKRIQNRNLFIKQRRSNWKREEMVRKWKAYSSKERIQQNSRVQVQYRREPHDTGKVKTGFVDFTSDNCLPYKKWTYDIVADTILSQEGDIKVADPITESIPERPARKPIILPTNGAILHHGDDASSVKDNRATHGGRMFRIARVSVPPH